MIQSLYKNWLQVSKITWGICTTSDKQWKFEGLLLSKIYILSAKTLIQMIYLNSLITYIIFETISHFSRQNSSVFFYLKHYLLSTKVAHQSANLQTFQWLRQCLPNTSRHFSNKKSWKIILLYSFSWNFMCYWQKYHIKVQISRLVTASIKIHQIAHVIFETKSQFFFKCCITLHCHET